jgi:hypothetical protein
VAHNKQVWVDLQFKAVTKLIKGELCSGYQCVHCNSFLTGSNHSRLKAHIMNPGACPPNKSVNGGFFRSEEAKQLAESGNKEVAALVASASAPSEISKQSILSVSSWGDSMSLKAKEDLDDALLSFLVDMVMRQQRMARQATNWLNKACMHEHVHLNQHANCAG